MAEINTALLNEYIEDSREHLDEMELLLLQLGNDLENIEVLNDIFRMMHNLKGTSQMTGLEKTVRLTHRLEDLLDKLRRGEMSTTPEIVMLLINGHDQIAKITRELEESSLELSDVEPLIEQVDVLLSPPAEVKAAEAEPELISATARTAASEQEDHELYGIFISQIIEQSGLLNEATADFNRQADEESLLQCKEILARMRGSSNYMGYMDTVVFFDEWLFAVESAHEEWGTGAVVSLDFMSFYLEDLIATFPQLAGEIAIVEDDFSETSAPATETGLNPDVSDIDKAGFEPIEPTILEEPTLSEEVAIPEEPGILEEPGIAEQVNTSESLAESVPERAPPAPVMPAVESNINYDLLGDFVSEGGEHLEEMEPLLLTLVADTSQTSLLDEIFRMIHNVKGVSQLIGLDKVSRLAHRLEDLLDLMRQDKIAVDEPMVDLVMEARDQLATLTHELAESQQEISSVDEMVARLTAVIEGDITAMSVPAPAVDADIQPAAELAVAAEEIPSSIAEPQRTLPPRPISVDNMGEEIDFSEEHDQELFGIFIEHFQEQEAVIVSLLDQLEVGIDPEVILDRCADSVSRITTSAHYMCYDPLSALCREWGNEITAMMQQAEAGKPVSIGFMMGYIEQVSHMLPEFSKLDDMMAMTSSASTASGVAEALGAGLPSAAADDALGEMRATDRAAPDTVSNVLEGELVERLSSALETSLQKVSDNEHEALNEVFDALMSSQSNNKEATANQAKQAVKQAKAVAKKTQKPAETKLKKTVRVDAEKIEVLMNLVGELVVDRSYFFQLFTEIRDLQGVLKENTDIEQREIKLLRTFTYRLSEAISALGRTSNELQEGVMKMRMLPVSTLFNRYPRLIHDLTNNIDKEVNLVLRGEDTELDRMIAEELADPLIHIIRNAIDHGIELKTDRVAAGKPEVSTIVLEAFQESNHIVIQVTDDGRGLNPDKIKQKAMSNGLYTEAELERMSPREVTNLILLPGLSTADKITNTSGRGVGMDVVKTNIEKLNGSLDIDSKVGKGTQVRLKIPLTLAIIQALMVRVGTDVFTIPLANVDETVRIRKDEMSIVEGVEAIYLRGETLPIFHLSSLFQVSGDQNIDTSFVVIVNTDGQRVGFVVDELLGQEEVVIKPLEDYVQERSGFSGATVVGDGRISLILDVYDLVRMTTRRHQEKQQKRIREMKLANSKMGQGQQVTNQITDQQH